MSTTLQVMKHALHALDYRREERMSRGHRLDFVVDVEIYYGLILEGRVEVTVYPEGDLEDHEVILRDKNEREHIIDWDDLSDNAQRRINNQIRDYLDEMRLCA